MGRSYYVVHEHIPFSTKRRIPWLHEALRPHLFAELALTANRLGCPCLKAGGYIEHVDLLVRKSRTLLTGELVNEVKRLSDGWLKLRPDIPRDFGWQLGYGAFAVSTDELDTVRAYIENQAEHHRTLTWEEEFRGLLERNGVDYDPRYYLDRSARPVALGEW